MADLPDDEMRPEPPLDGDEKATLIGFLEFLRASVRWKCDGLDAAQMNATAAASSMTLGGLLKHLALVEDYWFSCRLFGHEEAEPWRSVDWEADGDWDWHSAVDDAPESIIELWDRSVERARSCFAEAFADGGFDRLAAVPQASGGTPTLRWITVHMIEEYARHAGHADLIRESIDGSTGE
ncbi:MAG: DinB family protein [Ilumatobacteraceae bacterium]